MRSQSLSREAFEIDSCRISSIVTGDRDKPAIVLLHGFPNSSRGFRDVIPTLSKTCFVIAPDLPGSGQSDPIPNATFPRFADLMEALLTRLGVAKAYLYVHDYGAPVALDLAMRDPTRVLGLIIQNANAHRTGFGPQWRDTLAYWSAPTQDNERAATAHLTFEGVRDQYIGGVPEDIAARMAPDNWIEDWRVMNQPGRLDVQRALIADYGRYAARFEEIARYLSDHQPPALMLWGRHDSFFDCAEILSWLQALPRMEAHILDGAHLLLETHAAQCAQLIKAFVDGRDK